jgi:hypothetical protein
MIKNVSMYSKRLPESAMIPVIEEYKADIFPSKNPEVAEEVNSGFGIADIVLFNLDNDTIKRRQRSRLPSIKSYEILETFSVVNTLSEPELSITHLYNSLPYSEKVFKEKILHFLTSTGVADNIDNTSLRFNYRYESPLKEIVAIEAKVSNWKRGLYQAYRYRQYADLSYLALHSQYIDRAKQNLNLFEDLNVGLIRVDDLKNELEIIYMPIRENISIMDKVRFFACEEILEKRGIIQAGL